MAIIAIDWDHTIYDNAHDRPHEGVHEVFDRFRMLGHRIWIFSCNDPQWIRQKCEEFNIRPDGIWGEHTDFYPEDRHKIVADAYIDDRSVPFRDNWLEAADQALELIRRRGRP